MRLTAFLTVAGFLCTGCETQLPDNHELQLPDIQIASDLPVFKKQYNEVELARSFNNVDPTMVLGALVEVKTATVHSFDSVLKNDARAERRAISEVVFKNFVENSAVAHAEWLSFLSAHVNDSTRAEVTVTEVANVDVSISSIDTQRLREFTLAIPQDRRQDYGVVIGFRDFVISASLFKCQGVDGNTSGYGAKIGGRWFGKCENSSTDHRIIAVYSPLPFVIFSLELPKQAPVVPQPPL